MKLESAVFYSDASLTEVTSQVLIEGYLTSLSDFEDLAKINRAWLHKDLNTGRERLIRTRLIRSST